VDNFRYKPTTMTAMPTTMTTYAACFLGSVDKIDIAAVRGREWVDRLGECKRDAKYLYFHWFSLFKTEVAITSVGDRNSGLSKSKDLGLGLAYFVVARRLSHRSSSLDRACENSVRIVRIDDK
jgi:hypothetical protein